MKRILVLALLVLLVVATSAAAFAEEEYTVTATMKVTLAFINKSALGTLVVRYSGTPDNIDARWTFDGQVDGKPAAASGLAHARWTSKGYEGTITKVDSWKIAGVGPPNLPLPVAVSGGANNLVWAVVTTREIGPVSIPLSLQGAAKLPAPFQGDLTLSLTNAAGIQEIKGLPRTGDVPAWVGLAALALAVLSAASIAGSRVLLRRAA